MKKNASKDAVAKAAGARGGISKEKATRPGHVMALHRGLKEAGVNPSPYSFPFDQKSARKAATNSKPGKRPKSKKR
jgi:hypothetical protein